MLKLDQHAVAGGLDNAAVVLGDLRIEEFAPQRFEAFERAFLVRNIVANRRSTRSRLIPARWSRISTASGAQKK